MCAANRSVMRLPYHTPPPDDVLRACEAFAELNIPIRLRRFDDGMLVECGPAAPPHTVAARCVQHAPCQAPMHHAG
jgi:hypothetical protein